MTQTIISCYITYKGFHKFLKLTLHKPYCWKAPTHTEPVISAEKD